MLTNVVLPVLLILIVALLLNFPIYIALLMATIYLQVFVNNMPLQNLFTGLFESLTKNSLLAVPFFIIAGNIMATSSLGDRLVSLFAVFLKKIPGGLALSCIGANAVFGAISGSAPAATAAFGKILWNPLKDNYGEKEAAGLITSSGALSSIVPPALPLIMYAIITETSLAKLFMAGFIPGVLCVVILATYLAIRHRKETVNAKFVPGERLAVLKRGITALLLPVIILGSIYGGVCSPTEAGAVATVYAAIISLLINKDMKLRQFVGVFKDSARTIGQLFILIAASVVFSQALTVTQAPRMLQTMMADISPVTFLILINVTLLVLGMFFDPGAANLIVAPLLCPIGMALGVDPIHMGVIFSINLSIGMSTPPFGLSLFVSQSILKKPMGLIASGCVPFIACYGLALILITFVPWFSLVLPSILS